MRNLSKSKLLAFLQCPKRLWLEVHRPDLVQISASTQASFNVGYQVGDIARRLYDPNGKGQLIDPQSEGFDVAFARSTALLSSSDPIFEAGFAAGGALAFADVLLPVEQEGKRGWRMIEVKSSTSVKDYHRDDAAVQAYVARTAGVRLVSLALAHVDSSWIYPGDEDYQGLLVENDLTTEVFAREAEVRTWIAEAQSIARRNSEPEIKAGRRCGEPFECGFLEYCKSQEPQAEYPVGWLPRIQARALKTLIDDDGVIDMRDIPDELLNESQSRVKTCSLSNAAYFDAANAATDLAPHSLPAYFIDFETIQFVVPIWVRTRPYQQIPFQFSVHYLSINGQLTQKWFIDLTGNDPSEAFAKELIAACGDSGPVFVYNAGFEAARIRELSDRFPSLKIALLAINERIVDLLPIAKQRYYHPSQKGSWSIKKVLPSIAPIRHDELEGVQDGGMAMDAFREAISSSTTCARKDQIEHELLEYCKLDTYAMVKLWQFFAGRNDLVI